MERKLFTDVELYDGSGRESWCADVGISGDRIVAVAPAGSLKKSGAEVVECKGLTMTPGFIDVHSHSDASAVFTPSGDSKISQGVTCDIVGNCGFSDYLDPVENNDLGKELISKVRGNFAAYAAAVDAARPAMNIVSLCGHGSLRTFVMGYEDRRPAGEEMRRMKELFADALQHGAAGLSGGLWYIPGKFAETSELCEIASVMKNTGKPYATHIRSEDDRLLESVDEAIAIAAAGSNSLQISHIKTGEPEAWKKIDALIAKVEKARSGGMDVLADRYPYIYSSTSLRMRIVAPYNTIDSVTLCTRLKESPEFRREVAAAMKKSDVLWDRLIIVSSPIPEHRNFYGKNMVEISGMLGNTPAEAFVELLSSGRTPGAAYGSMCEENLRRILAQPWVIGGSDGSIRPFDFTGTHPRAFGTFPEFFRIASSLSTPGAVIRRMSAMAARKFNLAGRGVIAPGYYADLNLLELDKYGCDADFTAPNRKASGVHRVYVNGNLAYSADSSCKLFRPGKMLRV